MVMLTIMLMLRLMLMSMLMSILMLMFMLMCRLLLMWMLMFVSMLTLIVVLPNLCEEAGLGCIMESFNGTCLVTCADTVGTKSVFAFRQMYGESLSIYW